MTLTTKSMPFSTISEPRDIESRVRRSLGLGDAASGPKRRFVRDGEVAVVMVQRDHGNQAREHANGSSRPEREAAEASVRSERTARERAERALAEAQVTIRDLQTKLGHMSLARDEARGGARQLELEKQSVESALAVEREGRMQAEAKYLEMYSSRQVTEQLLRDLRAATQSAPMTKTSAGESSKAAPSSRKLSKVPPVRPAKPSKPEPEPVKWWITSKKAARR